MKKVRINMDKLNASQQKIVEYIIENNRITNRQIQELLGIKDSRALKIMKELIELGVVERQGKLKGSYYVLK